MSNQNDWEGFRAVARNLANASDTGSFRSSVSRAYYSVFKIVEDATKPQIKKMSQRQRARYNGVQGGSHARLIQYYMRKHGEAAKMSVLLNTLKGERTKADYFQTEKFDRVRAENALILAERIAKKITELKATGIL